MLREHVCKKSFIDKLHGADRMLGRHQKPDAASSAANAAWWSAAGSWIQFGATLISLWLAWHTLEIAQQFKDEDRRKDELSITPYITFFADGLSTKLEIRNDGLGPALIERVRYSFEDQHIDIERALSKKDDIDKFYAISHNMVANIMHLEMMKELVQKNNIKNVKNPYVRFVLPGLLLQKDAVRDLINIEASQFDVSADAHRDLVIWQTTIYARSSRSNIQVCYCSMSGNSCQISAFYGSIRPKIVNSCKSSDKKFSWIDVSQTGVPDQQ